MYPSNSDDRLSNKKNPDDLIYFHTIVIAGILRYFKNGQRT